MAEVLKDIGLLVPELKAKTQVIIETLATHRIPLQVFETLRSTDRQKELFLKGNSKTLNSRHLKGEAVDFVVFIDGNWSWDYKKYGLFYQLFGTIAEFNGLKWGARFSNFLDYPHLELIK